MQAIDRTFNVLRALASRPGTSTLADVTRATGLPKSTVLRLLGALETQGAVQTVGGRYAIGSGLTALSHHHAPLSALREIARPHLADLVTDLQEHVALAVADGDATLYLDTVVAESSVMAQDWTGERLPFHASAGGLALMATWDDDAIAHYAAATPTAFAPGTITTRAGLVERAAVIRRDGVAWTLQEYSEEVNGVGAVIIGDDAPVGALNAYGPAYRFPGARPRAEIEQAVRDAARRIGDRLTRPTVR